MNEKKQGYMQQVDEWCLEAVIRPLAAAWRYCHNQTYEITNEEREKVMLQAVEDAQKAIRGKLLESYRNGQKAGDQRPARAERTKPADNDREGIADLLGN